MKNSFDSQVQSDEQFNQSIAKTNAMAQLLSDPQHYIQPEVKFELPVNPKPRPPFKFDALSKGLSNLTILERFEHLHAKNTHEFDLLINSRDPNSDTGMRFFDALNKKLEELEISITDIKAGREPYMPIIGMPSSRKRDIQDAYEIVQTVKSNMGDKAVGVAEVREELKLRLRQAMKEDVPESTQRINTLINAVNGLHESFDVNAPKTSKQGDYTWMDYYSDNNAPAKIKTFTELSRDSDIVRAMEANKEKHLSKDKEEAMNKEVATYDPANYKSKDEYHDFIKSTKHYSEYKAHTDEDYAEMKRDGDYALLSGFEKNKLQAEYANKSSVEGYLALVNTTAQETETPIQKMLYDREHMGDEELKTQVKTEIKNSKILTPEVLARQDAIAAAKNSEFGDEDSIEKMKEQFAQAKKQMDAQKETTAPVAATEAPVVTPVEAVAPAAIEAPSAVQVAQPEPVVQADSVATPELAFETPVPVFEMPVAIEAPAPAQVAHFEQNYESMQLPEPGSINSLDAINSIMPSGTAYKLNFEIPDHLLISDAEVAAYLMSQREMIREESFKHDQDVSLPIFDLPGDKQRLEADKQKRMLADPANTTEGYSIDSLKLFSQRINRMQDVRSQWQKLSLTPECNPNKMTITLSNLTPDSIEKLKAAGYKPNVKVDSKDGSSTLVFVIDKPKESAEMPKNVLHNIVLKRLSEVTGQTIHKTELPFPKKDDVVTELTKQPCTAMHDMVQQEAKFIEGRTAGVALTEQAKSELANLPEVNAYYAHANELLHAHRAALDKDATRYVAKQADGSYKVRLPSIDKDVIRQMRMTGWTAEQTETAVFLATSVVRERWNNDVANAFAAQGFDDSQLTGYPVKVKSEAVSTTIAAIYAEAVSREQLVELRPEIKSLVKAEEAVTFTPAPYTTIAKEKEIFQQRESEKREQEQQIQKKKTIDLFTKRSAERKLSNSADMSM